MFGDNCVPTLRAELEMVLAYYIGSLMEKINLPNGAILSCQIDRWTARSLHFGSPNRQLGRPRVLLSGSIIHEKEHVNTWKWVERTR